MWQVRGDLGSHRGRQVTPYVRFLSQMSAPGGSDLGRTEEPVTAVTSRV